MWEGPSEPYKGYQHGQTLEEIAKGKTHTKWAGFSKGVVAEAERKTQI